MSRRPVNPNAAKTAQNQATIKSLLKLEANKLCADCKRNKHPRWASWNLGVFVCIRCSGIHRGMGTHISRVKSVDLDSWTDEQLQSMLNWGNARAKKYWEAKLAADHVPSEAKIENFIRTKYELKRWVMDGPMPDPSTLDAVEDDDVPLSLVKEKQNLERSESLRKAEKKPAEGEEKQVEAAADLIGAPVEDPIPQRSSTAGPAASRVPPKSEAAPPKTTSKDSLLGLDFFGDQPAAPPRPASTTGTGGVLGNQSRPDLKQSILSLYASAPRQPPQPSQPPGEAFRGGVSPTGHQSHGSASELNNALGNLGFSGAPTRPPKPADPFASLGAGSIAPKTSQPQPSNSGDGAFGALGAGSFFDSKQPAQAAAPAAPQKNFSSGGFADLGGFSSSSPVSAKPANTSSLGDLFDLSAPSTQPPSVSSPVNPAPAQSANSVFNLSSVQSKAPSAPPPPAIVSPTAAASPGASTWSTSDVWSSNAWGTADASATTSTSAQPQPKSPALGKTSSDLGGWGNSGGSGLNPAPKVTADEEFGGWTSSATSGTSKPTGALGGNEDLFSNVWQ